MKSVLCQAYISGQEGWEVVFILAVIQEKSEVQNEYPISNGVWWFGNATCNSLSWKQDFGTGSKRCYIGCPNLNTLDKIKENVKDPYSPEKRKNPTSKPKKIPTNKTLQTKHKITRNLHLHPSIHKRSPKPVWVESSHRSCPSTYPGHLPRYQKPAGSYWEMRTQGQRQWPGKLQSQAITTA